MAPVRRPLALQQARAALLAGSLSATTLVQDALSAARASQEAFKAFATIAGKEALAAAAESDRRYATGTARPLEGLPIGVKDLIDTRGIETRYGSAAYVGNMPPADAAVVRALVDQGAIVIGKTTTHEFAWGVTTASSAFGDTLNPLDAGRIPGGSSGGAAAAIACGAVAAGLGTDTGGSVRIPAALCGVAGFKPSRGALPVDGIFPLAPSLDHPGLLGAGVGDILLLANALGIGKGGGKTARPRLGVIHAIAPVPLEADVADDFARAIHSLGRKYACSELDAPDLFEGAFQAFAGIVLAEGGMVHFARNDWDFIAGHYGAETVDRLTRAKGLMLGDYAHAQQTRRQFSARLATAMQDADYLVLPTCPCVAPRVREATVTIGGWSGTVREALMSYTAPFNLAGIPAISIPLPAQGNRLPAGLQIVGRPGTDGGLLGLALEVEGLLAGTVAD
jgi:aspartyl-tRNA(Asn)/glutamyl-tRNA(Gln) amidotransferase subunit A